MNEKWEGEDLVDPQKVPMSHWDQPRDAYAKPLAEPRTYDDHALKAGQ